MSARGARHPAGARGQASVELLGAIPALLLIGAVLLQMLALGYASVLTGSAAEAGALALADGRDGRAAARRAVPTWSRHHMRVSVSQGRVQVRMRPPSPLSSVSRKLEVGAAAAVVR